MEEKIDNSKLESMMKIYPEELNNKQHQELLNAIINAALIIPVTVTANPIDPDNIEVGKVYELEDELRFKPLRLTTNDGEIVLPLFTSDEQLNMSGTPVNRIVMHTPDIQKMLQNMLQEFDLVHINPFDEDSLAMPLNNFLNIKKIDMSDEEYEMMEKFEKSIKTMLKLLKEDYVELPYDLILYYREEEPYMYEDAVNNIYTTTIPFNMSFYEDFNENYPVINKIYMPEKTRIFFNDLDPKTHYTFTIAPDNYFEYEGRDDKGRYLWQWVGEDFY